MTQARWHLGPLARSVITGGIYGLVRAGYWSSAGYAYDFWGVQLGSWSYGINRITPDTEIV